MLPALPAKPWPLPSIIPAAYLPTHPARCCAAAPLQEQKLIGTAPSEVAHFLEKTQGLNKTMIGDYLGERDDFNLKVRRARWGGVGWGGGGGRVEGEQGYKKQSYCGIQLAGRLALRCALPVI